MNAEDRRRCAETILRIISNPLNTPSNPILQDCAEAFARDELRSTIVCLCGSTRFKEAFIEANKRLTLAGYIVLSVGFFGHHEGGMDEETKRKLDALHLRKIDLCDQVHVLNVDGYIGESTANEIRYATSLGKPIWYLEKIDDSLNKHSFCKLSDLAKVDGDGVYCIDHGDCSLVWHDNTRFLYVCHHKRQGLVKIGVNPTVDFARQALAALRSLG